MEHFKLEQKKDFLVLPEGSYFSMSSYHGNQSLDMTVFFNNVGSIIREIKTFKNSMLES